MIKILMMVVLGVAGAKEITTNETTMENAPAWLTQTRVEAITNRVQQKLEWSTRRVGVRWYQDFDSFSKAHSLGPFAMAVTTAQNGVAVVHLGPLVNSENFDETFGHELVHVIILQKYKGAIPKWLEEGLANHMAKHAKVDYKWLSQQTPVDDVKNLAHPLLGSASGIRYRYVASQALAELLDKKCDLENLVRLSVGRRLEDYLATACEIPDINAAFKAWVKTQAAK